MPALAVSTVSAVPGQSSAAQTPAAVVLALPFATRFAGILDAALTSATGAAGPSSQPTAGDTQAGTTTATSHGADSAPVAGWAWGVPADTQDEPIRSTRPRVSQGPHHPQRPATSQDAAPAGAVASAVAGKVETSSSALTIKLAETKPGGQEVPEGAMAAAVPSGGNDRTQPGAVSPSSAGAASTPDTGQALSGATGSAPVPSSPAANTLPPPLPATRPPRRAGADSRAAPLDADQTAPTGGKDAAAPPAGVVPSNTAGRDADTPAAGHTGGAVLAAPDAASARAARGSHIGIRQAPSPASTVPSDAPASHPSAISVPGETDHPSNSAGTTAPAPDPDPSATMPGTAVRADQTVTDAAAGHARPNAAAPGSPAPAPEAAALAASAAVPASSDPAAAAAPASAAGAARIATGAGPASAIPSAPAAPSNAPTPAQQAAPALVSLGGGQGTRQVTVRLDPPELGRLQIRLVQPKDGPAQVTVTAERSQTLDLMVRDEVRLSRALDQAGVPAEGRSVTFHLAAAAPGTSADPSRSAPSPATPGPQSGGTGASDAGQGSDRGARRDGYASGQRRLADGSIELEDDTPRAVRWLRTGINITA